MFRRPKAIGPTGVPNNRPVLTVSATPSTNPAPFGGGCGSIDVSCCHSGDSTISDAASVVAVRRWAPVTASETAAGMPLSVSMMPGSSCTVGGARSAIVGCGAAAGAGAAMMASRRSRGATTSPASTLARNAASCSGWSVPARRASNAAKTSISGFTGCSSRVRCCAALPPASAARGGRCWQVPCAVRLQGTRRTSHRLVLARR